MDILAKINTGNAVHVGHYFESISGVKGFSVHCGSGKTGFRPNIRKVNKPVSAENITCKKCLKEYIKMKAEEENTDFEDMNLRQYVELNGKSFIIKK